MQTITVHGVDINYSQQADFWKNVNNWEPFTFHCIKTLVTPGSVFVDIGAWNGVFSVYAEKLGANVYAVEPDHEARKLLLQLWTDNGTMGYVCPHAISNEMGNAILMNNSYGNSESSLVVRDGINGSQPVSTITLSAYLSDKPLPSLIKIDIEGAEIAVLSQAREWITEHTSNMHISFHPAYITSYDHVMYLFNLYDVVSDGGSEVTADNFLQVLNKHEHAFLFTKKI